MSQGNRLVNPMMAAEEYLRVFQGAKRSGNTLAVLPKRSTQENVQIITAPRGCGDNRAGACVGFVLTARKGMRARSRLACGPFFPQRPQCDLFSASQGVV